MRQNQSRPKSHISYCVTARSHIVHMNVTPSFPHSHTCLCSARLIVNITHHHDNDRYLQAIHRYARYFHATWSLTRVSRKYIRVCICLHKPPSTLPRKSHPDFQGGQLVQNFVTYTRVNMVFTQGPHETVQRGACGSRAVAWPGLTQRINQRWFPTICWHLHSGSLRSRVIIKHCSITQQ